MEDYKSFEKNNHEGGHRNCAAPLGEELLTVCEVSNRRNII